MVDDRCCCGVALKPNLKGILKKSEKGFQAYSVVTDAPYEEVSAP